MESIFFLRTEKYHSTVEVRFEQPTSKAYRSLKQSAIDEPLMRVYLMLATGSFKQIAG